MPSPHAPIIPNDEFDGKSEAGAYGDFVVQTDYVVGEVLKTLKAKGLEENTIVIFSADNGPEGYAWDRALKYEHYSMGDFRGLKRDVWEGGHHVPFIVKWPGKVKSSSVSDEVVSQIDIMATLAKILDIKLPRDAAPDSYSLTPLLFEEEFQSPLRDATIHNTYASIWGIRKGKWLYINDSTGGHRNMPPKFQDARGYSDFDTPALLFDMENDPEQRVNLYHEKPKMIEDLAKELSLIQNSTYTTNRNEKVQKTN